MNQYTPTVNSDLPFRVQDRRKQGFFTIDNVLLDEYGAQLGAYGLAAYMCLARFANQDQECWPKMTTIAKRTGMSRRQAVKQIHKLVTLNLITVTPQYNPETKEPTSNLYTLLEVVGTAPRAAPSPAPRAAPTARHAPKQSLKKKDTQPKSRKDMYVPVEWADIIHG